MKTGLGIYRKLHILYSYSTLLRFAILKVIFGFEEKKLMTTDDGGMIFSDDVELIRPLLPYRWVGIDKDTWKRAANFLEGKDVRAKHLHYEIKVLGYKYNMNDVAAAIGLAQLERLDKMNTSRGKIIDNIYSFISK